MSSIAAQPASRRICLGGVLTAWAGLGRAEAPLQRPGIGVNLAGAEFGRAMPGADGRDYVWPGDRSALYYLQRGMQCIRLPFRWERLEDAPGRGLRAEAMGELDRLVHLACAAGGHVILDLHNYGRWIEGGTETIIGEGGPSIDEFAALWSRLAARYRDLPGVVFGLMNEPHDQDMAVLIQAQQRAIDAIRQAGARQLILATGNHWSGAHSWVSSGNGEAMLALTDAAGNLAFDVHQYLDARSTGATNECVPGAGASRLEAFTGWARQHGRRGFLGEFNAGRDALCLREMTALLDHLQANRDVWLGGAYWAGGPWWGEEVFAIEPANLADPTDLPQMTVLAAQARAWR